MLRLALLAALTIVLLTVTTVPSLGAAASASPQKTERASVENRDVEAKSVYYLNSKIRCPGKRGVRVWDANGKGRPSLGPGWYLCKWSSNWNTLMWFKEVHKGPLPCREPAEPRDATKPLVEPKC